MSGASLTHRGSTALETQSKEVYLLRFAASVLIIFSIWITLSHFPVSVEMINKLRKDTRTIFRMSDPVFDARFSADLFTLQNLQR